VLFMPQDISNQRGLARPAFTDEDAYLVITHLAGIKLSEIERHLLPSISKQN
jgi:hypothetical protein